MRLVAAFVAALTILFAHPRDVQACVPLRYEEAAQVTPSGTASEIVAEAATIELMRVVARAPTDADPIYAEYYIGGPYRFRLETVEVLKGFRRDALEVHGFASDTRPRYFPEYQFRRPEPLWWNGEQGYERLQETLMLDPADSGSMACASPLIFDVGVEYLVFRDRRGNLLSPAYRRTERPAHPPQRPVIEEMHGSEDPWLAYVRQAIDEQGARPATFWDAIFSLIFGDRGDPRR